MTFTESNTVEALVRHTLCGGATRHTAVGPGLARRHGTLSGFGRHNLGPQHLPRQCRDEYLPQFIRVQGSNLKDETWVLSGTRSWKERGTYPGKPATAFRLRLRSENDDRRV